MSDEILRRLASIDRTLNGNGSPGIVTRVTENTSSIRLLMEDRRDRKNDIRQIKYIFVAAILANAITIGMGVLAWVVQ